MVLMLAASFVLSACSGGSEAMTQPSVPAPAADLDTAKAPPRTVTSSPLLPPMPADNAQPSDPAAAAAPMQYEHLYSDDEQTKIQQDLIAAAARAQQN